MTPGQDSRGAQRQEQGPLDAPNTLEQERQQLELELVREWARAPKRNSTWIGRMIERIQALGESTETWLLNIQDPPQDEQSAEELEIALTVRLTFELKEVLKRIPGTKQHRKEAERQAIRAERRAMRQTEIGDD